jgi:aspartyl protease family protein
MNRSGHFVAEARLNGRKAEVLVDTGATLVAINESTARNLGIRLKPSDFVYKVRTANGITEAARAEIEEIEIGRVRVRNVQASVSRDESLSVILLGMAFLQKLKKFEISNGELVLTQ